MTVILQEQLTSILTELGPRIDTEEHRTKLGVDIYRALFTAYPQYVELFSKLKGLPQANVFDSDGIKYYGLTLVESLVEMLKSASNKEELDKWCERSGKDHTSRPVTKEQFETGLPVFKEFLSNLLTKQEDKDAICKLLEYIFPEVVKHI